MAKARKVVSTPGGGVLVREARKLFRYTDVPPARAGRHTEYRRPGDWNGPRTPDGKPKTYIDPDGNVHVAPGDKRPYLDPNSRPSFRKGVPEDVWEKAPKNKDGNVIDLAGREVDWKPGDSRSGVWDMGHVPEQQYRHEYDRYLEGKPPYHRDDASEKFRDWYNNPDHYRVEHPTTNRSRRHE
ncbi:GH-E family nuclease [Mariniluteicoccus flavus]